MLLCIAEGGQPYEAMREWFFRREAAKTKRPGVFDLNRVAQLWNLGPGPHLTKEPCGWLHLSGSRHVHWGPDIQRAIEVWEKSNYRGFCPYDLLAYLEPDQYLPFLASHPKPDNPADSRWLHVALDLARPLEGQFDEIQARCEEIRKYTLLLVGQKRSRPGRHEIRRDILVFTLHYSAGLTVPEVARKVFPKESQDSARRKVKDIIRRVRRAIDTHLLRAQRHTPPLTK